MVNHNRLLAYLLLLSVLLNSCSNINSLVSNNHQYTYHTTITNDNAEDYQYNTNDSDYLILADYDRIRALEKAYKETPEEFYKIFENNKLLPGYTRSESGFSAPNNNSVPVAANWYSYYPYILAAPLWNNYGTGFKHFRDLVHTPKSEYKYIPPYSSKGILLDGLFDARVEGLLFDMCRYFKLDYLLMVDKFRYQGAATYCIDFAAGTLAFGLAASPFNETKAALSQMPKLFGNNTILSGNMDFSDLQVISGSGMKIYLSDHATEMFADISIVDGKYIPPTDHIKKYIKKAQELNPGGSYDLFGNYYKEYYNCIAFLYSKQSDPDVQKMKDAFYLYWIMRRNLGDSVCVSADCNIPTDDTQLNQFREIFKKDRWSDEDCAVLFDDILAKESVAELKANYLDKFDELSRKDQLKLHILRFTNIGNHDSGQPILYAKDIINIMKCQPNEEALKNFLLMGRCAWSSDLYRVSQDPELTVDKLCDTLDNNKNYAKIDYQFSSGHMRGSYGFLEYKNRTATPDDNSGTTLVQYNFDDDFDYNNLADMQKALNEIFYAIVNQENLGIGGMYMDAHGFEHSAIHNDVYIDNKGYECHSTWVNGMQPYKGNYYTNISKYAGLIPVE